MPPYPLAQYNSPFWVPGGKSWAAIPGSENVPQVFEAIELLPSFYPKDSDDEEVVIVFETYEEILIELPEESFVTSFPAASALDVKALPEPSNPPESAPEGDESPKTELRKRAPEPSSFREFWDGIKGFGAKINPARLWRPAAPEVPQAPIARVEYADKGCQTMPGDFPLSPPQSPGPNYGKPELVSFPPPSIASGCGSDAGSIRSPPAPPTSRNQSPPPQQRYTFFTNRDDEINYLESKRLVSNSPLSQPGMIPVGRAGYSGFDGVQERPRGPGGRSEVLPGKPNPGRLDPKLLMKYGGGRRRRRRSIDLTGI